MGHISSCGEIVIELYARVFVKVAGTLQELFGIVTSFVPGVYGCLNVVAQPYTLDFSSNPYRSNLENSSPDDFLQYPYAIEVFADGKAVSLEEYLGFVSRLMTTLYDKGMDVVVACDWEERLPGGGKLLHG